MELGPDPFIMLAHPVTARSVKLDFKRLLLYVIFLRKHFVVLLALRTISSIVGRLWT